MIKAACLPHLVLVEAEILNVQYYCSSLKFFWWFLQTFWQNSIVNPPIGVPGGKSV
jgi:hypothetical protein